MTNQLTTNQLTTLSAADNRTAATQQPVQAQEQQQLQKQIPPQLQSMANNDTKQHILEVGYQLVSQRGFTAVGLAQLLKAADVPKGSFYHYFASKEAFGEALIENYFAAYKQRLAALDAQPINAQQKLQQYFQHWHNTQQIGCHFQKCLVVKLSAEVSDLSDPMRLALLRGYQQTTHWLAKQIQIGWTQGSIPSHSVTSTDANMPHSNDRLALSLANRSYYAWLGASLVAKISQSNEALDEVWQMTCRQLGIKNLA